MMYQIARVLNPGSPKDVSLEMIDAKVPGLQKGQTNPGFFTEKEAIAYTKWLITNESDRGPYVIVIVSF